MRAIRTIVCFVLGVLAGPCFAHEGAELNHHWDTTAYRTEMLSQIALMATISLGVLCVLWLGRRIKLRRSADE